MEILTDKAKEALLNEENWLSTSEDEPICTICKKRVVEPDIPLRLWKQGKTPDDITELPMHPGCAIKGAE